MKKILLLTTVVIMATAVMLSFKSKDKKNEKQFVNTTRLKENDDADAAGMAKYFYMLERDPATGKIDLAAYYKAMAQATSMTSSRSSGNLGLQWNFLGPDNIGGRTRAILFDKNNPADVFAGGVSGGLWISTDTGQSWTKWSGSDALKNMNIVSICQDDSGYIYFGTGEGFVGIYSGSYGTLGTVFPGYGVWKSTTPTTAGVIDTGINFAHLSMTTPGTAPGATSVGSDTLDPTEAYWSETNRLAANPHSPDSIIAATIGGILVSGNGGKTWAYAAGIPHATRTMGTDVKYSIDGKKVYASLNSSASSGSSATLYYSTNGGASFAKMNGVNGFPKTDVYGYPIARIEIAVSPTSPNYAYAALVNLDGYPNVYAPNYGSLAYVVQTTNGGATWNTIGTGSGDNGFGGLTGFDPTGPQGPYDLAVGVSPIDSNTVFVGGTVLWRWNLSQGWVQIDNYGSTEYESEQHADIHALLFDPSNSSRLIIGSDGGISQSLNPYSPITQTSYVQYSSLNRNYDVTQFYSVSADSEGRTIGGTQDNSVDNINFLGNTFLSANQILGGDGGSTIIASNNTSYFGTVPAEGGAEFDKANGGVSNDLQFSSALDAHTDSLVNLPGVGAQFILPFDLWEDADSLAILNKAGKQPKECLMAAGFNSGEVWITTQALNFGTVGYWFELQKVGGNVTAVKFSPDGKYLFVGTDAGNIYRYSGFDTVFKYNRWQYPLINNKVTYTWTPGDSGISFVQSSAFPDFNGRVITGFSVDPRNDANVVVTAGNYSGSDTISIATSTDTGFSFNPAQGRGATKLPMGPVYSSCMPISAPSGTILAGTWCGIWSSQDFGQTWTWDNGGLANVPVFSIREHPYYSSYAIYAGTFGRGLWSTQTLTTGINDVKSFSSPVKNLNVFPNPTSGAGYIQYTLAKQGNVIINLYDITGKLVKNIANENMIAGPISIQFNVADLASGTYIVDVIEGQDQANAKLAVLH